MTSTELKGQGSPTQSKSKVGVITITYNNPDLLIHQHRCVSRFLTDDHSLIVVDNSSDKQKADAIKYHAESLGLEYIRTSASSHGGSESHAFAANVAYMRYSGKFDYLFFIDHDCFPVKEFSVAEILKGKKIAGIGQAKNGYTYMWPGCVMWSEILVNRSIVDFSVNQDLVLDTGGELRHIIDTCSADQVAYFDEVYEQNPGFNKTMYNFYTMINNGTFMHFINGSNWNTTEGNEERLNSLINVLIEKTK